MVESEWLPIFLSNFRKRKGWQTRWHETDRERGLRRDSKIGEGGCCDPSKLVQVRVEQCWSYLWKRIVDVAPGPDGPGDLRLGPGDVIELQPGRPAAMEL